ncbi:MAG: transcriptional repressor [Bacteroidales bacterium]|nr:transcriptional repressor [Bacteroidales bacterium]
MEIICNFVIEDYVTMQPIVNIPGFEEFKSQLRKHNLRATSQRLAVHGAMMELVHASADMVAEKIAETSKVKITQSSVYNILAQLALHGIYRHRLSINNKMYFDVCNAKHLHMYDMARHTFRDLPANDIFDLLQEQMGKKRFRGYKVEGVDVVILARPNKKH